MGCPKHDFDPEEGTFTPGSERMEAELPYVPIVTLRIAVHQLPFPFGCIFWVGEQQTFKIINENVCFITLEMNMISSELSV